MQWNFTSSQVCLGEVHYALEDFLRDLQQEIDTNFPQYNEQQREKLCSLFYSVMFFEFTGHLHTEISRTFGIDPEFVEIIVANHKENIDMLGAIIMGIFLKNLQDTRGLLSDDQNLQLINAELRHFHSLYNL